MVVGFPVRGGFHGSGMIDLRLGEGFDILVLTI